MGSTSVRMLVAEMDAEENVRPLEALHKPVNLGRDVFATGTISEQTTEECVRALRGFRRVLEEYGIVKAGRLRAVATSAVREASNSEVFLDRVYIATGISVETIDEAEENRCIYLSVQRFLSNRSMLPNPLTLVVEVGGGSTEMLAVQGRQVISSHMYRLGAYRVRQAVEEGDEPSVRHLEMLESQIQRTVEQIQRSIAHKGRPNLLTIGGDIRFAAAQLVPGWNRQDLVKISVAQLSKLTQEILPGSVDALVRDYQLSYGDAETLGPALLAYVRMATAFKLRHIVVTGETMRDGLLIEMTQKNAWSTEFQEQIVSSAIEIGHKYDFDQRHGEHVANLALALFRALQEEHRLGPRHEFILRIAALLHEIGLFIGNRGHHKHSLYLIRNSNIFGFGARDTLLTALVARYHRRASPKQTHSDYTSLDRESRAVVLKLAAILRVADAFDRSHIQRFRSIEIDVERDRVLITVPSIPDLSLENAALRQKADLFHQVYGKSIVLRKKRKV
jgi:exopolyphosphatase/guanosine-5'-triphosphate,3'-diphosphate pyrophosphatase